MAPVEQDSGCPQCHYDNWHNGWLCRECGYPEHTIWVEYVQKGFVKPRSKEGKERARVAREITGTERA